MTDDLTHIDDTGRARMVDVGAKPETARTATATAVVTMAPETLVRIREGGVAKGDVLAVAQVAAVEAAKRTPDLIPMCHPLRITGVDVEFECGGAGSGEEAGSGAGTPSDACPDAGRLGIRVTVRAFDRTGVEMEAMVAASAAALTVYDMAKAIDRGMVIGPVRLEHKAGGKSGEWRRETDRQAPARPAGERDASLDVGHDGTSVID